MRKSIQLHMSHSVHFVNTKKFISLVVQYRVYIPYFIIIKHEGGSFCTKFSNFGKISWRVYNLSTQVEVLIMFDSLLHLI